MKADLDQIAQRLRVAETILAPMQVAGGKLTALQVRVIITALRKSMADARMTGNRIGELMGLLERHRMDLLPPAPRPRLQVIEGGVTRSAKSRRRASPGAAPGSDGPRAA